jgi:hypothetical protein
VERELGGILLNSLEILMFCQSLVVGNLVKAFWVQTILILLSFSISLLFPLPSLHTPSLFLFMFFIIPSFPSILHNSDLGNILSAIIAYFA